MTAAKYVVDVNTPNHFASHTLRLNAISVVNISTYRLIAFGASADNPDLRGFIMIDQMAKATGMAGRIRFARRSSQTMRWQARELDREAHAALRDPKTAMIWFVGLSGAGKSTIANLLEKLRHGLNRDRCCTDADLQRSSAASGRW